METLEIDLLDQRRVTSLGCAVGTRWYWEMWEIGLANGCGVEVSISKGAWESFWLTVGLRGRYMWMANWGGSGVQG
jgi:hypothetical protein